MTLVAIVVFAALLLAVALVAAAEPRVRTFGAVAAIPLVLTVVVPLPFAMMERRAGWPRAAATAITWAGIAASCILFAVGIALVVRAVFEDRRRAALAFAVETFVAGLPAAMFGVYAFLFR